MCITFYTLCEGLLNLTWFLVIMLKVDRIHFEGPDKVWSPLHPSEVSMLLYDVNDKADIVAGWKAEGLYLINLFHVLLNYFPAKEHSVFSPHCRAVKVDQKPFVWVEIEWVCKLEGNQKTLWRFINQSSSHSTIQHHDDGIPCISWALHTITTHFIIIWVRKNMCYVIFD